VFSFSRGEIRGFSIFTIILVLAVAAPFLFKRILHRTPSEAATADRHKLDSLTAILEKSASSKKRPETDSAAGKSRDFPITDFDPNLLTAEQWQALGLQKSLAQRIINYRKKGGKFSAKSDLLKIYGFPPELYARLAPYIQLPDSLKYARKNPVPNAEARDKTREAAPAKPEKVIRSFDLNLADSTQLVQIKGIGPGLSRRILNYRSKLGGFASEQQLKEVYGLDSLVVEEILKYAFVKENASLQKISVNMATFEELNAHPYISPKEASIMVDYRKQHGKYTSLESLYQIRALNKATLDKLRPYLSFE
jgi:DNA uptake protein ComE-like DNA-binding protein